MSDAEVKAEEKENSSDSSPSSSSEEQTLNVNDESPPAPVSFFSQSKVQTNDSTGKDSALPPQKAEPPKASPPPPEEEKSPPPPPPPKSSPKSSPPPSPPSPSKPPPSPPNPESQPQETLTTLTNQSPPKEETPTTPTRDSLSTQATSTPAQHSSPSSNTPEKDSTPSSSSTDQQSPPSPNSDTKKPSQSSPQNNTPDSQDSQPTDSSSDSDSNPPPSPPSTDTSQSAPSTNPSSTPAAVKGSTDSTPGSPPQTWVALPPPSTTISPSNSVGGGSSHNDSRSFNHTQNNIETKHTSHVFLIGGTVVAVLILTFVVFLFIRDRRKKKQQGSMAKFMATPANISVTSDANQGHPQQNDAAQQSGTENISDNQKGNNNAVSDSGVIPVSKTSFSYEEMMEITDGFARENLIGEGGFGCVYKGRLPDGRIVAVKQLKIGSGQGEREFRAEVEIITRVHHRHLVSLVGYCIANNQRVLIYEFVSNCTLERHLHDKELPVLEWAKRVKIALGAAKGLAYLHEDCHPKIIHRDIKSANILLDEDFEAQVADFGLARLNDTSQTHVSTRVMGTIGYLAPEYATSGKLTDRSDVYSFGVVILELITGRKPVDQTRPLGDESLVEWARPLLIEALKTGEFGDLIDPRLEKRYVESEVVVMIEAAAACVRHSVTKRPRMALVARALDFEGNPDLSNGVKVGQSNAYDSAKYSEEISRFRRMEFGCDNSSDSEIYSDESISREFSGGLLNSEKSLYSSGDSTIGESGTQGSKQSSSASYSGGSKNYGGGRSQ